MKNSTDDFQGSDITMYDTIMLASHAGASTAAISHFFNIPFLTACYSIGCDYTAITVVTINGEQGEIVAPRFELINDAKHIKGITTENVFGRQESKKCLIKMQNGFG